LLSLRRDNALDLVGVADDMHRRDETDAVMKPTKRIERLSCD
jgi:hypothetical protein